jgi:hypothetical protein
MKMQEIRNKAKTLGIKAKNVSKTDLIRMIQRAEGNFDCFGKAVDYCDQVDCCFYRLCLEKNR